MKLFSTSIQVFRGTSFSYFKIKVPFFCCPLCQIISRPLCHNQKNGKPAVSITTLVLQDQPQGYILSYFYRLVRALSHSRIFVEFSLRAVYSSIVAENFQIHAVQITGKCICELKKLNLDILLIHPPRPDPQAFIITTQADRNYIFPLLLKTPQAKRHQNGDLSII